MAGEGAECAPRLGARARTHLARPPPHAQPGGRAGGGHPRGAAPLCCIRRAGEQPPPSQCPCPCPAYSPLTHSTHTPPSRPPPPPPPPPPHRWRAPPHSACAIAFNLALRRCGPAPRAPRARGTCRAASAAARSGASRCRSCRRQGARVLWWVMGGRQACDARAWCLSTPAPHTCPPPPSPPHPPTPHHHTADHALGCGRGRPPLPRLGRHRCVLLLCELQWRERERRGGRGGRGG